MSVRFLRLDSRAVSFVLAIEEDIPRIVYFDKKLPADESLEMLVAALQRPITHAALDIEPRIHLLAEQGHGYNGAPSISLHREGRDWTTDLRVIKETQTEQQIGLFLSDAVTNIVVEILIGLDAQTDVLSSHARIENRGEGVLEVEALASLVLPVPSRCCDLVSSTGRWCREFQLARSTLPFGKYLAESRTGRTSHAVYPALTLCDEKCSENDGFALSVSLAWSGNHRTIVDYLPDCRRVMQTGPLFLPGEIRLAPGQAYEAPIAYACISHQGFNGVRALWHQFVRAHVIRPLIGPRRVHLNTWEAVYFDHDFDKLCKLADTAAEIGVERFVLDDGWFENRTDDHRALGDWWPDKKKYPQGLKSLIEHVTGLGMQFGLWVEPEMVNPDSELFRQHPDWILSIEGRKLIPSRHQFVLDLTKDEVFNYLFSAIDKLLAENDIGYLKWDHNRDLTDPGSNGHPAVDAQTRAVYRLFDKLRHQHPTVEIETCASGGGRADFEILRRTDRVWASDSNDALDRIAINKGFGLYLPPEIMGAHIGSHIAHTTGRYFSFGFQSAIALFGHFGLELDVTQLDKADLNEVSEWIALHKQYRPLLHSGRAFELECDDPAVVAHGVVSHNAEQAVIVYAKTESSRYLVSPPLRIPHLVPSAVYQVQIIKTTHSHSRISRSSTNFAKGEKLIMSGVALAQMGVQMPALAPATAVILHIEKVK